MNHARFHGVSRKRVTRPNQAGIGTTSQSASSAQAAKLAGLAAIARRAAARTRGLTAARAEQRKNGSASTAEASHSFNLSAPSTTDGSVRGA